MKEIPFAFAAALDDEIRMIAARIEVDAKIHMRPSIITQGRLGRKQVLLVRSGIGAAAMRNAVEECLKKYSPGCFINIGYCGGADPALTAGDLVIAPQAVDSESGRNLRSDEDLVDLAQTICKKTGMRFFNGAVATVDRVIEGPHDKAFIGTKLGVKAVDMESFAFLEACAATNVRALIVRAVLDPMDMELPKLGDMVDRFGETDPLAVAAHIIKKPKDIFAFPAVAQNAALCRENLSAFVDAWIES